MPNFVKVDSKPFHPDTYVGPDQEDEELAGAENSRESSMSIKLKVENTLRWRWVKDEDGNYVSPLSHVGSRSFTVFPFRTLATPIQQPYHSLV